MNAPFRRAAPRFDGPARDVRREAHRVNRSSLFHWMAKRIARAVGTPIAFGIAVLVVVVWALTGPLFHFSDTWQLVINTGTTIVTFLMVFLIQNTQYRDAEAVQIKLDELIRTTRGAHVALLDLEELTEEEIDALKGRYLRLAEEGRERLRQGGTDSDTPQVDVG
jgi:low affinity Fe/Cu permease